MTTTERNLWPQDLFTAVDVQRTPLALLREQATLLGEQTKNLVEAKVTTSVEPSLPRNFQTLATLIGSSTNNSFVQKFSLVSTALGNYTYELFRVAHPVEGYPVKVFFQDEEYVAILEDELIGVLKMIFAHEKTRRVIQAMIAQSQS